MENPQDNHRTLIAITGGIGAGKSVVSRMLSVLGYPVYDCDTYARLIIDTMPGVKERIAAQVTPQAIAADGSYHRAAVARVVFADASRLARLNAIVHAAVIEHLAQWCLQQPPGPLFVETAILYTSGLSTLVSAEWRVTAPIPLRIARVIQRSALTPSQINQRIAAQSNEEPPHTHLPLTILLNDNLTPLLPQLLTALQFIS